MKYQDSVTIKNNTERRHNQPGIIHLWDAENGPPGGYSQGNHRLSEITKNGMLKRALELMLGEVVEERSDEEFLLLREQELNT